MPQTRSALQGPILKLCSVCQNTSKKGGEKKEENNILTFPEQPNH
jgi:hypothetical protein